MKAQGRRLKGTDRSRRVFATYMLVVFTIAMTAQGVAAPPQAKDKAPKPKASVSAPVASEPVAEASASPKKATPKSAPLPEPVAVPAPAPAPASTPAAPVPVTAATIIAPSAAVTPVLVPGNPSLGDGGIRIDPPASGTYHYDDVKEVNEPGVPDDFVLTITVAPNGLTFSFTCNYPITEVIVKGGPDAYSYRYPSGTYGDSGLVSPVMDNGSTPALSHMLFYFGAEPQQVHIIATKFHDDGGSAPSGIESNGIFEGGEDWLGGFVFQLYSGPGADGPWTYVESATSVLPNGQADFGMHPFGWYKIVEVLTADQLAAGWYCTTSGGVKVFETTGEYNAGLWFGNLQEEEDDPEPGDLEVYKYLDDNENAEYDTGEQLLEGWQFTLYDSADNVVGSGATDATGKLVFTGLEPGAYHATETLKPGWDNTTPLTQYMTVLSGVTVASEADVPVAALRFGNVPDRGDLIVYKYLDANKNAEYDDGEEMLGDWQFALTQETPPLGPVFVGPSTFALLRLGVTDADGELLFSDLAPGDYAVTETLQDGWRNTTPLKQFVEVGDDGTAEVWFGNVPDSNEPETGDLVIHKYLDENRNGQYDDEEMLEGWEFTVVNPADVILPDQIGASVALIGSGMTGADGTLTFNGLTPGELDVTETPKEGWDCTTGLTREVQIVAGQTTHVWYGNAEDFLPFTELDLAITKVADDHTVNEGQLVTYTLTYWNLMSEEDAYDYTIVDDFDERYLAIVNAGGGTVSGGKITWEFAGPLSMAMGKQTITYTARVIADMPDKTTNIDNAVVIDDDRDFNPDNNRDDERVIYTPDDPGDPDDPFLPFTGGDYWMLLVSAATAVGIGLVLRSGPKRAA